MMDWALIREAECVVTSAISDFTAGSERGIPDISRIPAKFPDGWEANQAVLTHLAKHRVAAS
jgi:hypothetical protein